MFHAKIKSETLKGVVDVVSTLVDEAKFNIDADGIELKAVDPAHVAMVDMKVEKSAFEEFSADETELGIDLDKIKEVLRLSRAGDIIEMEQDEAKNRLVLNVGNITRRMNLVDTAGMSDPKVPNLNLPAKITVTSDELQKGIRAAESVSDHIALNATPEGFEMFSEGDTDSVSLKLPKDLLISLECHREGEEPVPPGLLLQHGPLDPCRLGRHHQPGQRLPGEAGVRDRGQEGHRQLPPCAADRERLSTYQTPFLRFFSFLLSGRPRL